MDTANEKRDIPPNQLNLMGKMACKILDQLTNAPSYIKGYSDMELVLEMVRDMIRAGKEGA